jgi:excisionase family DNA binding protein
MPRASSNRPVDLLTVEEVARLLRLPVSSVRGLIGSRRLRAIRVTKDVTRIERAELHRFLSASRLPPR